MGHIKGNEAHEAAMRRFKTLDIALQTASNRICSASNRLCDTIENSNGQLKRALMPKEPSHG